MRASIQPARLTRSRQAHLLWGGLIALADQYAHHDLGFVNPLIYRTARSSSYSQAFHDVATGNNSVTSRCLMPLTLVPLERSPWRRRGEHLSGREPPRHGDFRPVGGTPVGDHYGLDRTKHVGAPSLSAPSIRAQIRRASTGVGSRRT